MGNRTPGWSPSLRAKAPGGTPGAFAHLPPSYAPATVQELEIKIRWRDVDNYGHVNNAVYLTYLEECRDRWVRQTLGPAVDFVIVRIAIDFRRELSLEDDAVVVTCRGTGHGTSSIRTAETIRAKAGWVAAEAESVVVAHDPVARKARRLTPRECDALEEAIGADAGELSPGGSAGRT
jgi:acyl-CoA thioester hydrolase